MGDPASQSGLKLSALTEIRVGAPKIPMASTLVSGGANGSNGSTSVPFAAFPAFSFYGASYNTVHVGSNGYVTFGSGDTNGNESECQMEDDPRARIAACWDSLDPTSAASGGGVFMDQTAKTVTVTWRDVPEAGITANAGNNMTIQLYNNGAITIYFGSTSMSDGLTGISPGFGIASDGNRNLSRSFNSVGSFIGIPSTASAFQRFETQALPGSLCSVLQAADTCDLFTLGDSGPSRITFYPNGSGGYRLFTGTR